MKTTARILLAICLSALPGFWPCRADQPNAAAADNVLIDVSASLIRALAPGEQTQTTTDSAMLGDISATITARIRARGGVLLLPNDHYGVIDALVQGDSVAKLQARVTEPNLIIYATARSTFTAGKRLYLDAGGLHSHPAQAWVNTELSLDPITDARGSSEGLIPSVADGVFALAQPKLERAIDQQAGTALKKQVDDQLGPSLAQANQAFASLLAQIRAFGIPLKQLHFSTTSNVLTAGARIVITDVLPGPAPRLAVPFDLGLRVHQSAINEGAQAALAGKTFTVSNLPTLPGSQSSKHGPDPFTGATLTFADQYPLVVHFAQHGFTIEVNVKELRAAGLRLPGLKVKTAYKFVNSPGQVVAVRQGPVAVSPYYGHRIGGHTVSVLLEHRLNSIFAETIAIPSIEPPSVLSQIGTLAPVYADADRGWLAATWVRRAKS